MCTRIQAPSLLLHLTFLFGIAFASVAPTLGQTQCTQRLSSLPAAVELYGFRLGMSKEEVKLLVPQTHFGRTDDFGVAKTTINPSYDSKIDKEKFAGVRSISLDFLDERLTSLWIGYDETYKAHTVHEFVKQITQSLQLSGTWTSWRSRGQQLQCNDFQIIVSALAGGPSVRIVDIGAEDIVAARRQAKEEEREAAAATAADPDAPAGAEAEEVIGDRNSKTYYPPECQPAKAIDEKNKIVFKTTEEARKSGFTLAKVCQ